jgi:mannuronan synthase
MRSADISTSSRKLGKPELPQAERMPLQINPGSEHANTSLPFTAVIDGRQFNGSSLSLVSATVSGLAGPELEDAERVAVLKFGFGAYAISVPVAAHVSRTNADKGMLLLQFSEPAGEHLPTLRYILNAYVAGDLVSLGGLIKSRETKSAKQTAIVNVQATASQRLAMVARTLATVAATGLLLLFAGKLAMTRFFSSDVAQLGVISQGSEAMRAIASGQLSLFNPSAAKGEVVYAIRAASGNTLNVVMPCDCKTRSAGFNEGSTVLSGETVLEVVKPGTPTTVEAEVSAKQAKSLLAGDVAEMHFAGGTLMTTAFVQDRDSLKPIVGTDKLRAVFVIDPDVVNTVGNAPVAIRIVNARVNQLTRNLFGWATP